MLLADAELEACESGTGAAKRNACRRRNVYVERAKRLGWCLEREGASRLGRGWEPCPRRRGS